MKTIYIFTILVSSICFSQNKTAQMKEIDELHRRTNFIRDSIGKLIKICNEKLKNESDLSKKDSMLILCDSLWNISDLNDIE